MNLQNYSNDYAVNHSCPNFRGQASYEIMKIGKNEKVLIHETAFFREPLTIQKSINILKKNFSNIKNPFILVGACSSGEQALSIKMLSNKLTPRIIGFDISKKSINDANSKIYKIYQPVKKKDIKKINDESIAAYSDAFLAFDTTNKPLTSNKKHFRKQFHQTFDEIGTSFCKKNFFKRFMSSFIAIIRGDLDSNMNIKTFKVKDKIVQNCQFVQGDILEINKITNDKAHMLTFSNAMYHLVTDNSYTEGRQKLPPDIAKQKMIDVARQVNKVLHKKGLFVLGENEDKQLTDMNMFSNVLQKHGFKPLSKANKRYCNIWEKYEDIL